MQHDFSDELRGPDRWKERSRFFPGIAEAMADQWGDLPMQGDLFSRATA